MNADPSLPPSLPPSSPPKPFLPTCMNAAATSGRFNWSASPIPLLLLLALPPSLPPSLRPDFYTVRSTTSPPPPPPSLPCSPRDRVGLWLHLLPMKPLPTSPFPRSKPRGLAAMMQIKVGREAGWEGGRGWWMHVLRNRKGNMSCSYSRFFEMTFAGDSSRPGLTLVLSPPSLPPSLFPHLPSVGQDVGPRLLQRAARQVPYLDSLWRQGRWVVEVGWEGGREGDKEGRKDASR